MSADLQYAHLLIILPCLIGFELKECRHKQSKCKQQIQTCMQSRSNYSKTCTSTVAWKISFRLKGAISCEEPFHLLKTIFYFPMLVLKCIYPYNKTIFKQVLVNCQHFTQDAKYRPSGGAATGHFFFRGSEPNGRLYLAVGQNQRHHFGVGEFTSHFRTYFSGWIGMFTGVRFGFWSKRGATFV